jgi:outer membrane murein-binding lipoprotein Lpp
MLRLAGAALLLSGCVSQQKHDQSQQNLNESRQKNAELQQEYQQLNQAMSAGR